MGFFLRTLTWPIVLGSNWIKSSKMQSKVFRLILDDETISYFEHARQQKSGFELLQQLLVESDLQVLSLEIDSLPRGFSAQQELRDLLKRWKSRFGRSIFVHLRNPTLQAYWLASVGDYVHISSCQDAFFVPISTRRIFYGQLLNKIGVQADVIAAGECKSFGEPYTRSFPTQPNRQQLKMIFDQLQSHLAKEIWESRQEKCMSQQVESYEKLAEVVAGGMLSATQMFSLGLIDSISYIDQYEKAIAEFTRCKYQPVDMSIAPLLKIANWDRQLDISCSIAQVNLEGTIVEQSSGGKRIESKSCVQLLQNIRKNDSIKGVVLVIDSPGGSAVASDRIARAIDKLIEKKPVVAYMRNVAASGGYYIASRCLHITAQPTTITGSIGVVGGKVVLGKALERLGVNSELISGGTGENASIFSTWTPFSPSQRKQMHGLLERTYERFLEVVSGGRKMPIEQVRKIAEGRVYTGIEAHNIGLVDELGGIDVAKRQLAKRIGVRRVKTIEYTVKKKNSLMKRIGQLVMTDNVSKQHILQQDLIELMFPDEIQMLVKNPQQPLMILPFSVDDL